MSWGGPFSKDTQRKPHQFTGRPFCPAAITRGNSQQQMWRRGPVKKLKKGREVVIGQEAARLRGGGAETKCVGPGLRGGGGQLFFLKRSLLASKKEKRWGGGQRGCGGTRVGSRSSRDEGNPKLGHAAVASRWVVRKTTYSMTGGRKEGGWFGSGHHIDTSRPPPKNPPPPIQLRGMTSFRGGPARKKGGAPPGGGGKRRGL